MKNKIIKPVISSLSLVPSGVLSPRHRYFLQKSVLKRTSLIFTILYECLPSTTSSVFCCRMRLWVRTASHYYVSRYGPRSILHSLWNMQNSNSLDSSVGEEIKQHNVVTHRRQFFLCLVTIRDLLYSTPSDGSSLLLPINVMLICMPKLNMHVNLRNNFSWLYWLLLLCTACRAYITVIETRLGDAGNISSSCLTRRLLMSYIYIYIWSS